MVEMVETDVKCCKIISEDVKDAVVLEGLPELGLIGNILGWLLVEELKMKQIGYIDSGSIPTTRSPLQKDTNSSFQNLQHRWDSFIPIRLHNTTSSFI